MKVFHRGEPEPGLLWVTPALARQISRVREQYGRLSAYRLGWRMGFAGQQQLNPYGGDTRRGERFYAGWCDGFARRAEMRKHREQQP